MSDYICPYTCSYRTNSGYCGLTGGAENCQMRMFLGYNSETRQFIVEPVAAGNIIVQSFQTNADRIRAMGDVELAKFLWDVWRHKAPFYKECVDGWPVPFYHWLKTEVES